MVSTKTRLLKHDFPVHGHFQTFFGTFRAFVETFFGHLGPRPGRLFRGFLETFWRLAPRILLPYARSTEPQLMSLERPAQTLSL